MPHQVRFGECFRRGFEAHGVAARVTDKPDDAGDLHVVMGPWFALNQWQSHPRCIHADRAFWGDPDCLSIGWSRPDGSRRFPTGEGGRLMPHLMPAQRGRRALVLADYGDTGESMAALVRPHVESVTVRRHPADITLADRLQQGSLSDALRGRHIAIGKMTTALIDAAIAGLAVVCLDKRNPVMPVASNTIRDVIHPDRQDWLQGLAWGNWSATEIETGEAWECWTTRCD